MSKVKYTDIMTTRFAPGTFRGIKRVLEPYEDRTEFIRAAVQKEINRRATLTRNRKKRNAANSRT